MNMPTSRDHDVDLFMRLYDFYAKHGEVKQLMRRVLDLQRPRRARATCRKTPHVQPQAPPAETAEQAREIAELRKMFGDDLMGGAR
jgi:hypothetical protein